MLLRLFFHLIFLNFLFIGLVESSESSGMPQLNPEFWLSQIFWLIIAFGLLFIVLSKFILPKIKLCSVHFPLNEINYFYAPSLQDFQKQTLSIFDIDENKILNSDRKRHIEASELIVVDHPWYHKGFILNEVEFLPAWIIYWLRDVYLKHAKQFDNNEKIYIDRTESKFKHCQIQNDKEVFGFLNEKGFSKYRTGELSFFEQIYLFYILSFIFNLGGRLWRAIISSIYIYIFICLYFYVLPYLLCFPP